MRKIDVLRELVRRYQHAPIVQSQYVNEEGQYCVIGHMMDICGVDMEQVKANSQVNTEAVDEEYIEDFTLPILDKGFNMDELKDLQSMNDRTRLPDDRVRKDVLGYLHAMIDVESAKYEERDAAILKVILRLDNGLPLRRNTYIAYGDDGNTCEYCAVGHLADAMGVDLNGLLNEPKMNWMRVTDPYLLAHLEPLTEYFTVEELQELQETNDCGFYDDTEQVEKVKAYLMELLEYDYEGVNA